MNLGWLRRADVVMVTSSAPTYVATSEILRTVSPFDLTPLRFLTAALLLGLYLLWRHGTAWSIRRASTADRWKVAGISVVGYGLYGTLLNAGQTTVPAGTASLLLNSSPVFAVALGFLLLGERTTRRGLAGVAIAVLGTGLVAVSGSGALGFDWNALTILAAALILAVFLIAQQPLLSRLDPVELVFWGCLIGGVVSLPLARFDLDASAWGARTWLALGFLILTSTVIAYSFWNLALAATSVSEGGSLLFAVPVFSLTLGWALLGQVPSLAAVAGGVIALGGVIILTKAPPVTHSTSILDALSLTDTDEPPLHPPAVPESVAPLELRDEDVAALKRIADRAVERVGARLATISLWRPESDDLVRIYTSLPDVYRLGGVSAELGGDWKQQCVVRRESYLADSPTSLASDAFEHHDTLARLDLGAAINSVVVHDGAFVGCLNLLDRPGSYGVADLEAVDALAGDLGQLLARVGQQRRTPGPVPGAA